jgi:hypothetical protein
LRFLPPKLVVFRGGQERLAGNLKPFGEHPMDQDRDKLLGALARASDAYLRAARHLLKARVGVEPNELEAVQCASDAMDELERRTNEALSLLKN